MAPPDLNSLPPSRSLSSSPIQPRSMHTGVPPPHRQETPSPHASATFPAVASNINPADISRPSSVSNRGSPHLSRMSSDRRRSQVAMNINLNDPNLPGPGEFSSSDRRASMNHSYTSISPNTIGTTRAIATGDPHHQRQPSLGEIHNELEQEQEAQVNRMLQMIREQQLQLDALRNSHHDHNSRRSSRQNSATGGHPNTTAALGDDLTLSTERSTSFPSIHPAIPTSHTQPRRLSRNTSSANRSPALRPLPGHESSLGSSGDWPPSPLETTRRNSIRDESGYYQAETAALIRDNQMLRIRIRELEKQINELSALPASTSSTPSNVVSAPPIEDTRASAVASP